MTTWQSLVVCFFLFLGASWTAWELGHVLKSNDELIVERRDKMMTYLSKATTTENDNEEETNVEEKPLREHVVSTENENEEEEIIIIEKNVEKKPLREEVAMEQLPLNITSKDKNWLDAFSLEALEMWWENDPPGMDPPSNNANDDENQGGKRTSIWNYELSLEVNRSRSNVQRKFPHLVFLKVGKVGGTSLSVALNDAARRYGVRLAWEPKQMEHSRRYVARCVRDGSLFFHHAFALPNRAVCVPAPRFVTLIRDPVAQALSWEVMVLERPFFMLAKPTKKCDADFIFAQSDDAETRLRLMDTCQDDALRLNVTMQAVAFKIRRWPRGFHGTAVTSMFKSFTGSTNPVSNADSLFLNVAQTKFFLVGVTERLNEFLVLLSLHLGWDPSSLYYARCKTPGISLKWDVFKQAHPTEARILSDRVSFAVPAYEWARDDFARHVSRMPTWFPSLVHDFETGLADYQKRMVSDWGEFVYLDGFVEKC